MTDSNEQSTTLARAIVSLFNGVHCRKEVLAWARQCSIAGIACRISTPSPVPAWATFPGRLRSPLDEMYREDPRWPEVDWGMINDDWTVTIENIGVELLDSAPKEARDLLRFDKAVVYWKTAFVDWLAVLSGGPTGFMLREFGAQWVTKEREELLSNAAYDAGEMWHPEPITKWQWGHAFWHVNAGQAAPLALKLLAHATRDAIMADGRNAVIHAATAAECALTNGISCHLSCKHSVAEARSRLAKAPMLGRRISLAETLGLKVPENTREFLLKPRNSAVHAGESITNQAAWRAVRIAEMIVNEFDPLPAHCEEPIENCSAGYEPIPNET